MKSTFGCPGGTNTPKTYSSTPPPGMVPLSTPLRGDSYIWLWRVCLLYLFGVKKCSFGTLVWIVSKGPQEMEYNQCERLVIYDCLDLLPFSAFSKCAILELMKNQPSKCRFPWDQVFFVSVKVLPPSAVFRLLKSAWLWVSVLLKPLFCTHCVPISFYLARGEPWEWDSVGGNIQDGVRRFSLGEGNHTSTACDALVQKQLKTLTFLVHR